MHVKRQLNGEVVFDLEEEFKQYGLEPQAEVINDVLRTVLLCTEEQQDGSKHPFRAMTKSQWQQALSDGEQNPLRTYAKHRGFFPNALFLLMLVMSENMASLDVEHVSHLFSVADALYADYVEYLDTFKVPRGERVAFSVQARPSAKAAPLPNGEQGVTTEELMEDYKKLTEQGKARDVYYEKITKEEEQRQKVSREVADEPPQKLSAKIDVKARIDSKKLAELMDESFASSTKTVARDINQSMTLWLAAARFNPNGVENERKMNAKMDTWRQYLYQKKQSGDMTRLASQIGDLMGDPRVYQTLNRYKMDKSYETRGTFPSKNSARLLARNNTLNGFISTVQRATEKVENTGEKVRDTAMFGWKKGMFSGNWISSWFLRTVLAADSPILVLGSGILGAPTTGIPGFLTLVFGSLLAYMPNIVMSLTNTQVFDLALSVLGKLPKFPTAVQIEELFEHMLDKLYPAAKHLLPIIRPILKFTRPLWNTIVSMMMGKIIELSQQIKDMITPDDYHHVWAQERINLLLLRIIHLFAFALRSVEEALALYENIVISLVLVIVKWVIGLIMK